MKSEQQLSDLYNKRKIIVLLGAGGVGKTSCSLGIAISAARSGKKVGLLSIDPAKRLAAALGLSLGGELKYVLGSEETPLQGSLQAGMLDQKSVFDGMVRRHASDKETAEKILSHRLYLAASTKLSGPIEYMALAKLQDMIESQAFDLVVLDTPPDTQALDFLSRPNILAGFMENKVMTWLIKPFNFASRLGFNKIFSAGEKLMGGLAKVTGFQALHSMTEFLMLIQHVIEGFHQTGEKIINSLSSAETGFLLVTSCQKAAVRSAKNLAEQIHESDYRLDGIIANRSIPKRVSVTLEENATELLGHQAIDELYARLSLEKKLTKEFIEYFVNLTSRRPIFLSIPERMSSLHSEANIYNFSKCFDRQ